MEEAVKRSFEEMLLGESYRSTHLTEKMKLDILAYTLNHLPPRYVVTEKGHLYTRANELQQQFQTDIIVELSNAIEYIRVRPRIENS
jgi:competence protein ComFB